MDESVLAELRNGAEYDCYADFEAAVRKYSEKKCYLFAVIVEQLKMRTKRLYQLLSYSSKFVYAFIELTCKHYGKPRVAGKEHHPNQRYMS